MFVFFIRSLTPPQSAGIVLAVQFRAMREQEYFRAINQ
jgi:hypothetical protein